MENTGNNKKQFVSVKTQVDGFPEAEEALPNFPILSEDEDEEAIPRYTAVLNKTGDNGVGMEDLDQLQQDLEKLLSMCAVRNRMLLAEVDEEKKEEKGKATLKRKRPEDRFKLRGSKNCVRILKGKHNYSLKVLKAEVPKIPRSDIADKFWHMVDFYCPDITKEKIAFIDDLVKECSEDIDVKIPELGEYYALEWAQEIMGEENAATAIKLLKGQGIVNGELKKNGYNAMLDIFASPLTQRLVSAFVNQKVMTKFPQVNEKLKPSDLSSLKSSGSDRSICTELVQQGILKQEDAKKVLSPDDEILQEIKKCQQELAAVNEHNVRQLNKLKMFLIKDQKRLEVKAALKQLDRQITSMYEELLIEKQKAVEQQQQLLQMDDDDDTILPKERQYINHDEADKILKHQATLSGIYLAMCQQQYKSQFES